jgi:hypothetical protein
MSRRPRKQKFHFPAATQPEITDEMLDAEISGAPSVSTEKTDAPAATPSRIKKDAEKKKDFTKAVAEIPEIFAPEQVAWVFDVYVGAICFIFSILMKVDFNVFYEELKIDDELKMMWAKPLARVLSKYAPSEWAMYSAEIELIASVGVWTATAFGRAKQIAQREKEKEKTPAQRNRVTAVPPAPATANA